MYSKAPARRTLTRTVRKVGGYSSKAAPHLSFIDAFTSSALTMAITASAPVRSESPVDQVFKKILVKCPRRTIKNSCRPAYHCFVLSEVYILLYLLSVVHLSNILLCTSEHRRIKEKDCHLRTLTQQLLDIFRLL